MSHDIFISYSKQDKSVADALCAGLEAAKMRCWVAPRDIQPRQEWAEAIIDGIAGCRVFVIILSAGSNESPQVLREVERAVSQGKVILPFRIEDCPTSKSLEYYLSVIHWLDAMNEPLEKHIAELVRVLRGILEETPEDHADTEPIPVPLDKPEKPRRLQRLILVVVLGLVLTGVAAFFLLKTGPDQSVLGHDNVHKPNNSNGKVVYE